MKLKELFHFITANRDTGGHILACRMQNVTVKIDLIPAFYMVLPQSRAFGIEEFQFYVDNLCLLIFYF